MKKNEKANGLEPMPLQPNGESMFAVTIVTGGFVHVGDVELKEGYYGVRNSFNIRQWGSEKGLGEVIKVGPLKTSVIDDQGTLFVPEAAMISIHPTSKDNWKIKRTPWPTEIAGASYPKIGGDPLFCITVVAGGFVHVGFLEKHKECYILRNSYNCRQWGTENGLGELVRFGPRPNSTIDEQGTVFIPYHAMISMHPTLQANWKALFK